MEEKASLPRKNFEYERTRIRSLPDQDIVKEYTSLLQKGRNMVVGLTSDKVFVFNGHIMSILAEEMLMRFIQEHKQKS